MSLHPSSLIIISMLGMLVVYIETESDVERGARLTGGTTGMDGIVEVYVREKWVLVCDDWFDEKDGMVICRMIGADEGLPMLFTSFANFESNPYAQVNGVFGYSQLACEGTETNIADCSSTTPRCGLSEQVGLKCHSPGEDPWTPAPRSTQAGRPMATFSPAITMTTTQTTTTTTTQSTTSTTTPTTTSTTTPNITTPTQTSTAKTTQTIAATTTPNIMTTTAITSTISESPKTTTHQSTTLQVTTTTNLTLPARTPASDSAPRMATAGPAWTAFRKAAGIIVYVVLTGILIFPFAFCFAKTRASDEHSSDISLMTETALPIEPTTI